MSTDLMSISIFSAAEYICKQSGWGLSNLKLQKLLYFAQMVALGAYEKEIISEDFQAWALGPVNSDLYHEAKIYGSDPVKSLPTVVGYTPVGDTKELLDRTLDSMGELPIGRLILISHWSEGAWAKNYIKGDRNRIIPKSDMAEEYRKRMKHARSSANAR